MSIAVERVRKVFGTFVALGDVTFEIPTGQLVALLGPSGSGKTTLLRIIAGLETPDTGRVLLDGADATDRRARDRRVGFVFQHYALFRHMTVFENVAFGLRARPRRRRPPEAEIRARVGRLLALVGLDWLAGRRPAELSSGQRQRVALARALAVEPRVLLLDEPFGALDAAVRKELRGWLRRLHDELHVTSAFVTHDVDEALEVADRVVVIDRGRVEQVGTPAEVYDAPANPFVYGFLGGVNRLRGRLARGRARVAGLDVEAPEHAATLDAPALAFVRPHDVDIERERNGHPVIEAVVRHVRPIGAIVRLGLVTAAGGEPIEAELTRPRYDALALRTGELVFLRLQNLTIFADDGGQARA